MFPRWGTLLTYGSALVMSMLRRPGIGSFGGGGEDDDAMAPGRRFWGLAESPLTTSWAW